MKIEIDIDLESIVLEALKKKEITDIYVPPIEVSVPASPSTGTSWEYARPPEGKQRRTGEEMALHRKERELGRRLTPEEKGQVKAHLHIADSKEEQAKEDTIKRARIEELTTEGLRAAEKELAEEKERRDPDSINGNGYAERAEDKNDNITRVQEGMDKHDIKATIPKTKPLENTDSLFT